MGMLFKKTGMELEKKSPWYYCLGEAIYIKTNAFAYLKKQKHNDVNRNDPNDPDQKFTYPGDYGLLKCA